jgi:hypothetical protein
VRVIYANWWFLQRVALWRSISISVSMRNRRRHSGWVWCTFRGSLVFFVVWKGVAFRLISGPPRLACITPTTHLLSLISLYTRRAVCRPAPWRREIAYYPCSWSECRPEPAEINAWIACFASSVLCLANHPRMHDY